MVSIIFNLAFGILGAFLLLLSVVSLAGTVHDISRGTKTAGNCGFLIFVCILLIVIGSVFLYKGVNGSIEEYMLEGI